MQIKMLVGRAILHHYQVNRYFWNLELLMWSQSEGPRAEMIVNHQEGRQPMTIDSTISVSVSREIKAPPEHVYDAWLDPVMVPQWFAPGMGPMTRVDIDPRLGGVFHLDQQRDAEVAGHWGVYLELDRPNRLVFTWCVDGAEDEDIVSIDISPLTSGAAQTGSTVSITHQIDVSYADYTEATRQGWRAMLRGLARGLESAHQSS